MNLLCKFNIHEPEWKWRFIKIGRKDGYEFYKVCKKCNKKYK